MNYIGFRCVTSTNSGNSGGGQTSQSIHFDFDPNSAPVLTNGTSFALNAWSDSGNTVTFSNVTDTLASINGSTLTLGPGTVTIAASVAGGTVNGTNFNPASRTVIFTVVAASSVQPNVAPKTLAEFLGPPSNIVDQSGLNAVLAHYWLQSPPWITNATFPGRTNFCFNITNFAFTVQYSTNLTSWQNLPAHAHIGFDDTNAPGAPNRYYRLVGSTNY